MSEITRTAQTVMSWFHFRSTFSSYDRIPSKSESDHRQNPSLTFLQRRDNRAAEATARDKGEKQFPAIFKPTATAVRSRGLFLRARKLAKDRFPIDKDSG